MGFVTDPAVAQSRRVHDRPGIEFHAQPDMTPQAKVAALRIEQLREFRGVGSMARPAGSDRCRAVHRVVSPRHILVAGRARIRILLAAKKPGADPAVRIVARKTLALCKWLVDVRIFGRLGGMAGCAQIVTVTRRLESVRGGVGQLVTGLAPVHPDRTVQLLVRFDSRVTLGRYAPFTRNGGHRRGRCGAGPIGGRTRGRLSRRSARGAGRRLLSQHARRHQQRTQARELNSTVHGAPPLILDLAPPSRRLYSSGS